MKTISNLLGRNWRTTLWGSITVVAVTIYFNPSLIEFLPDNIESYVKGFSGLIAICTGSAFVANTKDKQVSGPPKK